MTHTVTSTRPQVILIGAGFGGLDATRKLWWIWWTKWTTIAASPKEMSAMDYPDSSYALT